MPRKEKPIIIDDENPEWTADDFTSAKRPQDVLSPEVMALFPNTKVRGPQKAPTKVRTTVRLDPDVVQALKDVGPRWQTRMNALLRHGLNLDHPRRS